jgi:hypothetical protein
LIGKRKLVPKDIWFNEAMARQEVQGVCQPTTC